MTNSLPDPQTAVHSVTVRPALRADLVAIAALIEPFVAQGRLLRRTIDELETLLAHVFVAEAAGRIVGCAAVEIYSPKLAELRSLAVEAAWQGQGVGKLLVQACVERARERNVLEVMTITSAEGFFKSCGFDFTLPGEKKALFVQTRHDAG